MTNLNDDIDGVAWLASSWTKLLEPYKTDGKSTLRVRRLEVTIGTISAQLNASKTKSYKLEIAVPTLEDNTWKQIIDALSSQALYAAQMLSGSLPTDIQDVFTASGCTLLPHSLDAWSEASKVAVEEKSKKKGQAALTTECVATDEERMQSLSAVYAMLGQLFEEEPWMLLELYGRTRPQILQALRESRVNSESTPPAVSGLDGANGIQSESENVPTFYVQRANEENEKPRSINEPGLEEQLDTFWGAPKRLRNIHHRVESPEIELVLMRRLGPPPFSEDSIEIYERFMALYRSVEEQAIKLAYAAGTAK